MRDILRLFGRDAEEKEEEGGGGGGVGVGVTGLGGKSGGWGLLVGSAKGGSEGSVPVEIAGRRVVGKPQGPPSRAREDPIYGRRW